MAQKYVGVNGYGIKCHTERQQLRITECEQILGSDLTQRSCHPLPDGLMGFGGDLLPDDGMYQGGEQPIDGWPRYPSQLVDDLS